MKWLHRFTTKVCVIVLHAGHFIHVYCKCKMNFFSLFGFMTLDTTQIFKLRFVRFVNLLMVSLLPGKNLVIDFRSAIGSRMFWRVFSSCLAIRLGQHCLWTSDYSGYFCRCYVIMTQDFTQVMFITPKIKVSALPVTRASLGTLDVLTPHRAKKPCFWQKTNFKRSPEVVYPTP